MQEQQERTRQEIAIPQDFTISMISAPRQGTENEQYLKGGNCINSGPKLCHRSNVAGHLARDRKV